MGTQRKSALHNFYDTDGDPIKMAALAAMLGVTTGTVRNRLRAWTKKNGRLPEDLHLFLVDSLGGEGISKSQVLDAADRQIIAEAQISEEKLWALKFENAREKAKYLLTEDVQRAIDGILLRLQQNLYSIPEQIVDPVRVSRDRHEALEIITEALEHHMREISQWEVPVKNADIESEDVSTETEEDNI